MLLPIDLEHIIEKIDALQVKEDETLFIMFAENDIPDIEELIRALNNRNINFFGGIFPGIIYGEKKFDMIVRLDTPIEVEYYRNGGILHTVLRQIASKKCIYI